MVLHLRDEDYYLLISEFSDFEFNIEESVLYSKEILENIKASNPNHDCVFEEDIWTLFHLDKNSFLKFDFSETFSLIQFSSLEKKQKEVLITVIKTWIAQSLSVLDYYSVQRHLRYLNRFLKVSNCFDEKFLEECEQHLRLISSESKHTSFYMCISVLNFLDYYSDFDSIEEFYSLLLQTKDSSPMIHHTRKLPPAKDVFMFSTIVDDFFSTIPKDSKDYIHFFAIYFWWTLTNIIPLRPFEFCSIDRQALSFDNGSYYLRLPRSTKKGSGKFNRNRIQIVSKIKIPNELGIELQDYIKLTNDFGFSQTLISYPAIRSTLDMESGLPNSFDRLSTSVMYHLLERFYDKIVFDKYSIQSRNNNYRFSEIKSFSTDSQSMTKIALGDTRHFAFLNLMRLGYNPVEIARLGGHTSLKTQYHYHSHQEFILDVEVLKLMNKFRFEKNKTNSNELIGSSAITENFNLNSLIKNKFVKKSFQNDDYKNKLEIGYCTDKLQRCLVHDCSLCDYWRISPDEFLEKQDIINKKIEIAFDKTKSILSTIQNIHKHISASYLKDPDLAEFDSNYNRDLSNLSKELDDSLANCAKLKLLKERNVLND